MKIKFWGAAKTVTGSAHLLDLGAERVLLDCGLFQGRRAEARQFNSEFAAPPASIHTVLLSHAHLDHCGNLPQLVKNGFEGRIMTTSASADITRAILYDSGRIQERDAEYLNRHRQKNEPPIEPLYTTREVEETVTRLATVKYGSQFHCANRALEVVYRDAGHILGSAFMEINVPRHNGGHRLIFSGDIGRSGRPLLRDPEPPDEADTLIMESTYGNRCHRPNDEAEDRFRAAVSAVLERGGKVIIPAFSVERTQEVVYTLNKLWNKGALRRVPVFVDSPLSANVTEIYRRHMEDFDEDAKTALRNDPDPFGFEGLIYVREAEHSKRLNRLNGACIIISASGMCEAGRILHHLANNIGDRRNAVLIVGFMAQNTLGRKLVDGHKEVRILGDMHKVEAQVITMNDFSGHGDAEDLKAFAGKVARSGRLKNIFLVHGDEEALTALQRALKEVLPGVAVHIPARGQTFEV